MTSNSQALLRRLCSARVWDGFLFVLFGGGGLFFLIYGIVDNDRITVVFALACFAMAKAANAMLYVRDLRDAAARPSYPFTSETRQLSDAEAARVEEILRRRGQWTEDSP